jgi:IS4 transposase
LLEIFLYQQFSNRNLLRKNTKWEVIENLAVEQNNATFFYAKVLLGHPNNKMRHALFVVGFKSRGKTYWIATDRDDLSAEQIAFIYSLRWQIETFFAWWKKHLNVYHLISRNPHGVLVQLLAGLITYLLLVIYFHQKHRQKPCVKLLRKLKWDILHDLKTPRLIHISLFILIYSDLNCPFA